MRGEAVERSEHDVGVWKLCLKVYANLCGVRVTEFFLGMPFKYKLSHKSKKYGGVGSGISVMKKSKLYSVLYFTLPENATFKDSTKENVSLLVFSVYR